MSPVRTAAAARPGRRRFGRGLRFGWSRTPRRGSVTLLALAAYLTTVVTAPAWHHHDHPGHDHAHEGHACLGHDHAAPAAEPHACHAHHGHDHDHAGHSQEKNAPGRDEDAPAATDSQEHGHACPICELIATPVTPVTTPVVCDLGDARPTLQAPTAPDRRAVFLRTKHAGDRRGSDAARPLLFPAP